MPITFGPTFLISQSLDFCIWLADCPVKNGFASFLDICDDQGNLRTWWIATSTQIAMISSQVAMFRGSKLRWIWSKSSKHERTRATMARNNVRITAHARSIKPEFRECFATARHESCCSILIIVHVLMQTVHCSDDNWKHLDGRVIWTVNDDKILCTVRYCASVLAEENTTLQNFTIINDPISVHTVL